MSPVPKTEPAPVCASSSCTNLIIFTKGMFWRKYCSRECSYGKNFLKKLGPRETGPTSPQDKDGNYLCKRGHIKVFIREKETPYGQIVQVYRCPTCRQIGAYVRLYSMTWEAADKAITNPQGPCEICNKECRRVVDHHHGKGEFRGFLCQACNSALGHFQDNPELLKAGLRYLEERGHYG